MVPEQRFSRLNHPAGELPLAAEKHHPSIAMPNEQTPLLNGDKAMQGVGVPAGAGLPAPPTAAANNVAAAAASSSLPQRRQPQAIAHRGYKLAAPENSMAAFRAAVECGAAAIETDLHLSRDGVVVLSHDETLARCFGDAAKVRERDWADLSKLRTLRQPAQGLPRLLDLLEYLNRPGREHVWLMLDIKTHDDPNEIIRRTAETLASVPGIRPWNHRITLCCWTSQYIKLSMKYLPGYKTTNIAYSTIYARELASQVPDLSISMLRLTLAAPFIGQRFIRHMKRLGHPIHTWTVNDEAWMEWCIRKELDGVITDDPKLFLEVCERVGKEEAEGGSSRLSRLRRKVSVQAAVRGVKYASEMALFHFLLVIVIGIYLFRNGLPRSSIRKTLQG
ncbi:PLC-like phosphodiesterase [Whalleya microplaca]|nr:PLC-like phosphodiesterase [Whalleya microplaca]